MISFARRYFSPQEVDLLASISDPEIQRCEFLKLWTLKVRKFVRAIIILLQIHNYQTKAFSFVVSHTKEHDACFSHSSCDEILNFRSHTSKHQGGDSLLHLSGLLLSGTGLLLKEACIFMGTVAQRQSLNLLYRIEGVSDLQLISRLLTDLLDMKMSLSYFQFIPFGSLINKLLLS